MADGKMQNLEQLDTIPKRLEYFSRDYPDKELLVFHSRGKRDAYSATRLLSLAGKFAALLVKQGFGSGDVIISGLPASPEKVITDLGATLARCSVLTAKCLLADGSDLYDAVHKTASKAIILSPNESDPLWSLLSPSIEYDNPYDLIHRMSCDSASDISLAIVVDRRDDGTGLLEQLDSSKDPPILDQCQPTDDVILFATSGSTGLPKLIAKTHADILNAVAPSFPLADSCTLERDVCFYNDRSLGWIAGYPHTTYAFGDKRVLLDMLEPRNTLTKPEVVDIVDKEKCNVACILPGDVDILAKHITSIGRKLPLFERIVVGGQPVGKAQVKQAFRLSNIVIPLYGASEIGFVAHYALTEAEKHTDYCCGKPHPGITFRAVGDDGATCAPGVVGALHVKGPNLFNGYYSVLEKRDTNTDTTLRSDGWIDLGDYGYLDNDGNVYIMGRTKDAVIRGGLVVYPGWLQAKIQAYPGVLEAFILPVPDPVLNHRICACVKTDDDSDFDETRLREICAEIFPSKAHKLSVPLPDFYKVLKTSEFPETATGKPDRMKLIQMMETFFG